MQPDVKPWYELWFDSPFYHILYKHRNQEEAADFIDVVFKHLKIKKGSVLDLACGKGRHAYYIAQKGLESVGIDLSQNSIAFAKTMYQLPNLEFYVHDMRLPFRINYFDYIFNIFTSIGYFDHIRDNQKVFDSAYAGLKTGGYFLVDFMNAEKVTANLVDREKKEIDGLQFYIRREVYNGKIIKYIKIEKEERVYLYREEVQALMPYHFHTFLKESGFSRVEEFGDYDLNPFNPKLSDRYILLAQKTGV